MEDRDRIIVRQNSLAHATALFIAGKSQDILATAEKLEAWVWRDIGAPATQAKGGAAKCSECENTVSQKVKEYSEQKFKKVLCFDCQQKKR